MIPRVWLSTRPTLVFYGISLKHHNQRATTFERAPYCWRHPQSPFSEIEITSCTDCNLIIIMAGRILANLIVMGGTVLLRAGSQAWRQAIVNGQKAGVNAEQAAKTVKGTICEAEARQILGIDGSTPREEVLKKFQTLYEANEKHGSFYLQSKVFRAMETLDPDVAEMVNLENSSWLFIEPVPMQLLGIRGKELSSEDPDFGCAGGTSPSHIVSEQMAFSTRTLTTEDFGEAAVAAVFADVFGLARHHRGVGPGGFRPGLPEPGRRVAFDPKDKKAKPSCPRCGPGQVHGWWQCPEGGAKPGPDDGSQVAAHAPTRREVKTLALCKIFDDAAEQGPREFQACMMRFGEPALLEGERVHWDDSSSDDEDGEADLSFQQVSHLPAAPQTSSDMPQGRAGGNISVMHAQLEQPERP
ncbi:hypothetical protein CYMTET_14188, partial [Cymbomonas tetramitiformis]